MNTKPLLATLLVIGSSTAAFADSDSVRDHRDNDDQGMVVRDHRPERLEPLTVLSQNAKLSTGRSVTRVSSWRKFDELKLQATKGETEIEKVMIRFANGRSQVVMPDQEIEPGSPSLTINLRSDARISSITVFGHAKRRASFEIFGA